MFKNKSFNVKIVNDKLVSEDEEVVHPAQKILVAQAYSAITKDLVADVATNLALSVSCVIVVKTLAKVTTLAATRLFR